MNSMDIVKVLSEYLESQIPFSEQVQTADKVVLNCACFDFLSWLKLERKREIWISQGRKTKLKPLELNLNYDQSKLLAELVKHEPMFSNLFEVKGSFIGFKDSVPEESRSQIREDAFNMYNPPRFL